MHFKDRTQAGKKLAQKLAQINDRNVVIYALPRGGVVLGYEVAKALGAPLSLVMPRKIGHPQNPEYAICAVTESGVMVCNQQELKSLDNKWLEQQRIEQVAEAKRRRQIYLSGAPPISAQAKTALLVDDGVATGLTMRAAIKDIRAQKPRKLIVAVPVVPADTAAAIKEEADELIAIYTPQLFSGAVGAYYDQFNQVEDETVINLLKAL